MTTSEVPRRRRKWPWITLGAVLVILVAVAVVAEIVLRQVAHDQIAAQVASGLSLPADKTVDVEVGGGPMLFQLASGSLSEVSVSIDDVTFGQLRGDVDAELTGVPLDASGHVSTIDLTLSMPESAMSALSGNLSGLPLDSITLDEPEIVTSSHFTVFGIQVPIGMGLTPSVEGGALVFTPSSIRVAGSDFSADSLRNAPGFGSLATRLLDQRPVCAVDGLPKGVALTDADVVGDQLVLKIHGEDVSLTSASAAPVSGSCSLG